MSPYLRWPFANIHHDRKSRECWNFESRKWRLSLSFIHAIAYAHIFLSVNRICGQTCLRKFVSRGRSLFQWQAEMRWVKSSEVLWTGIRYRWVSSSLYAFDAFDHLYSSFLTFSLRVPITCARVVEFQVDAYRYTKRSSWSSQKANFLDKAGIQRPG